jgi:peptidoglycan/LPS O-acetylase OafA/YrhL
MNNYYANFDEGIRKVMLFRLDSIGFGVAVAYIFTWHYSKFQILKKFWWLFLMIIFIVVISTKYNYFGYESSVPVKVFYFSISGFAFAGLLPVFYAFQASQINWLNKFVRFTSSISYSMYLAHIFAFMLGINLLQRLNIHTVVYPNPWLIYLLFFLFVYMLSSCTYFFIEKPFLRMRDKTSRE